MAIPLFPLSPSPLVGEGRGEGVSQPWQPPSPQINPANRPATASAYAGVTRGCVGKEITDRTRS